MKEDTMLRLLLRLTPANLVHEFGSGRALDNARREHEEFERMSRAVDALVGRLEVAAAAPQEPALARGEPALARGEKESVAA
jgi:hypothetical protein